MIVMHGFTLREPVLCDSQNFVPIFFRILICSHLPRYFWLFLTFSYSSKHVQRSYGCQTPSELRCMNSKVRAVCVNDIE